MPHRPILSMIDTAPWINCMVGRNLGTSIITLIIPDSFLFLRAIWKLSVNSFSGLVFLLMYPLRKQLIFVLMSFYIVAISVPLNILKWKYFKELVLFATEGVEFSFNYIMYSHIDGVIMGSPLGSVLTNIFVDFHDDRLFKNVQEPIEVVVGEC